MSRYERFSWTATALLLSAWAALTIQFWNGNNLAELETRQMAISLGLILAAATIGLVLASTTLWSKKTKARDPLDEREISIENRAEKYSYYVLDGCISTLIVAILWETAYGPNLIGNFSLLKPEGLIFALASILIIAALTRFITAAIASKLS
ncbi:hypothetical protein [Cohaesibacter gelatinilyticus]|uniref:Uncharacterized protein n=1 Tax=Cohaesibacter gelatinilyticus TaxID=372072 RepID=A0A285PH33_9HYPH|nr:hypothetical protein [Cohaesibacter gelatinilyticus]SNZ21040.1 hypothetical protein SAMN06265368_4154 [Cohaesibacter gelatinilyticus]HAT85993.1 hypothetical protein [Hyphomicrobiales bacterium]